MTKNRSFRNCAVALFLSVLPLAAANGVRELQASASISNCDTVIGTVTAEQVREMGRLYLESLVDAEDVVTARDIIFRTVKYDFQAVKLCSSCADIDDWYYDINEGFPATHRNYCDQDKYGFEDTQSALIFLPLSPASDDENTPNVITNTKLRAFLYLRPTYAERNMAPTEAWPPAFAAMINAVQDGTGSASTLQSPSIKQLVPSMLAAASGSIAILPDYIGYGESTINASFMNPRAYEQAAVVSFLATRRYLYKKHSCTILDFTAATIQGMEDGAFGAAFVAQALRRFNIKILSVFAGTGIFDLETLIDDAIRTVDAGGQLLERSKDLLGQAAFAFSVATPGLANTGSGQQMVSEASRAAILAKYGPQSTTTVTTLQGDIPVNGLDILNPDLVRFYRNAASNNIVSPCKTDAGQSDAFVGRLCQAIAAASAWPTLRSEDGLHYTWIHLTELCYSETDPIVSPRQVLDAGLTSLPESPIYPYAGPKGTNPDDTLLKPIGSDHERILDICRISSGLFFGLQGHTPVDEKDHPSYMVPLDAADAERCGLPVTEAPPGETSAVSETEQPAPGDTTEGTITTNEEGGGSNREETNGEGDDDKDEPQGSGVSTFQNTVRVTALVLVGVMAVIM